MFALFVSVIIGGLIVSVTVGIVTGQREAERAVREQQRAAAVEAARREMQQERARQREAEAAERREQRSMEAAERREEAVRRYEKKLEREHEAEQRRAARQQEAQAKAEAAKRRQEAAAAKREAERAARLAAARELAEMRERELAAARELRQLQRQEKPTDSAGAVACVFDNTEVKAPEAAVKPATDAAQPFSAAPVTLEAFAETHAAPVREARQDAPQPFAGQVVSFTGKLSMPRREAIEKVQHAGGRAYKDMPAGTTLLVVGSNPGMQKMDKADRWIGQVRKITEAQFIAMFPA